MAQAFITRRKGGGGVNKDLPAQITAFTATADSTPCITLSWVNPTEYWAGTLIVKKAGSAPEGVNDGEKIYKGEGTSYTDVDVQFDTEYFYRAFAHNEKKQYQTLLAVASAKPVAGIALSSLAEGVLVNIMEDGVAVPFYLAKHDYESGLNGAGRQLMVPEKGYEKRRWHSSNVNAYATSEVDTWQNTDYKAKFSEAVQAMMGTTKFYYTVGNGSTTKTTLSRAVFLLSKYEYGDTDDAGGTSYNMWNDEGAVLPIADILLTGHGVSVMTRTPRCEISSSGSTDKSCYGYMNANTHRCTAATATDSAFYVVPSFTLPATALVNPTPNADGSYTLIE